MSEIIKEKVFWEKPYSRCADCLKSSRLKCKRCMAEMISLSIKQRQQFACPKMPRIKVDGANPSKSMHSNHSDANGREYCQVNNNFQLWIKKGRSKKLPQLGDTMFKLPKWPQRKVVKAELASLSAPKFETWQFRMVQQLSKSQPYVKLLQESKQLK